MKADDQGRYAIPTVAAGRYDLKIAAAGFRNATQSNLEVSNNVVVRQDVRLEVGAATESVTVLADAVQLQTDKSDVRSEITSQAVTSLPLPNYRKTSPTRRDGTIRRPAREAFSSTRTAASARSITSCRSPAPVVSAVSGSGFGRHSSLAIAS